MEQSEINQLKIKALNYLSENLKNPELIQELKSDGIEKTSSIIPSLSKVSRNYFNKMYDGTLLELRFDLESSENQNFHGTYAMYFFEDGQFFDDFLFWDDPDTY
ncbi:hypothetical protein KFE98_19590 [bacterium SCSIO 12741]|nr:hypothetical protein KFE98_19590 [bacterium SCSIO 12741]